MPEPETDMKSPAHGTGNENDANALPPTEGRNYIIAIGIDQYKSALVKDFANRNCEKDCNDLIEVLTLNYENFELYKDSKLINEKATKAAIQGAIKEFVNDPDANNTNNNLVLFFSGHGGTTKQGFNDTGCWIPHGCATLDYDNVVTNDDLKPLIKRIATQNFLLISDACLSGRIFDEIAPDLHTASASRVNDKEISRWAIVSSRSDEPSKSGGPGKNSQFSEALINVLRSCKQHRLLVSELIGNLDSHFIRSVDQKPYAGRLTFDQTPNNGHFVFNMIDLVAKRKKREQILKRGLGSLNYDAQEEVFEAFGKTGVKKQIAIFTGTPDCGLKLLSLRARKALDFPKTYDGPFSVAPLIFSGMGTDRVLNIFNAALDKNFPDIKGLSLYLQNQLSRNSLLIEFVFYHEEDGGSMCVRPADKVALLDELADFAKSVNDTYPDANKLILFVVDYEKCQYQDLYHKAAIAGLDTIFMPPVEQLDYIKTKKWYRAIRATYDAADLPEFDDLLGNAVFNKLESVITETQGYPGKAIRRICNLADCDDLANKLLDNK